MKMLNAAQIAKLQKQVGKKVSDDIQKREDEAKRVRTANFIEIRRYIKELQTEYTDRGACLCLWEGQFYVLNRKEYVEAVIIQIDERVTLECIKEIGNKKYYFMKKELYDYQKKFIDFITKHYAHIKIAQNSIADGSDRLRNMLMIGTIFEEFQKEFPSCTMIDFIQGIKSIDSLMRNL